MKTVVALLAIVITISAASLTQPNHGAAAAKAAQALVGTSRAVYVCNQAVNQAIYGQKNVVLNGKNMLAAEYRHWGKSVPENQVQPGDVIVGKNGAHVGIIGPDGKSIIHSSSSKYAVVSVPLSQAKYIFPAGYDLRRQKN
jgi:hypothetical protein